MGTGMTSPVKNPSQQNAQCDCAKESNHEERASIHGILKKRPHIQAGIKTLRTKGARGSFEFVRVQHLLIRERGDGAQPSNNYAEGRSCQKSAEDH